MIFNIQYEMNAMEQQETINVKGTDIEHHDPVILETEGGTEIGFALLPHRNKFGRFIMLLRKLRMVTADPHIGLMRSFNKGPKSIIFFSEDEVHCAKKLRLHGD